VARRLPICPDSGCCAREQEVRGAVAAIGKPVLRSVRCRAFRARALCVLLSRMRRVIGLAGGPRFRPWLPSAAMDRPFARPRRRCLAYPGAGRVGHPPRRLRCRSARPTRERSRSPTAASQGRASCRRAAATLEVPEESPSARPRDHGSPWRSCRPNTLDPARDPIRCGILAGLDRGQGAAKAGRTRSREQLREPSAGARALTHRA
jgi:hypothetical protein